MMHKIEVEQDKLLLDKSNTYFLEIDSFKKIDITIKENVNVKMVLVGKDNYDLNIILEDNSKLIINSLNKDNCVKARIFLNENSDLLYNYSVISYKDSLNRFNITHLKNNSKSILNNNGLNILDGKLFFQIDGEIEKKLENVTCSQNSKIINYANGNSKIIPNLIIDSNDIVANHAAYIGKISDEYIFYLKSRGLSDESIKKLFFKGILLGKMVLDEEEEKFNQIINEWW